METRLMTNCLVIGALLAPYAAHAVDSDSDRKHPMIFVKDSAITTKIKAKLAAEKMANLAHISVETDRNGVVVLSGTVKSLHEADKAVRIARGTDGVKSVSSKLQIVKGE